MLRSKCILATYSLFLQPTATTYSYNLNALAQLEHPRGVVGKDDPCRQSAGTAFLAVLRLPVNRCSWLRRHRMRCSVSSSVPKTSTYNWNEQSLKEHQLVQHLHWPSYLGLEAGHISRINLHTQMKLTTEDTIILDITGQERNTLSIEQQVKSQIQENKLR